ncbi:MAG: zinc metalloprotease HtpX [Nitrososphaeria archaeon]
MPPAGSLLKLRLAMLGAWIAVTALGMLVLAVVLAIIGTGFSVALVLGFVLALYLAQWLLGPYLVNAIYRVKPLGENEEPWLHGAVSRIAEKAGISKPRLMLAQVDVPNAFAYGSPLTGNMVAVTRGLLNNLPQDEVEAVLGHELGHLKHRDVYVMMMVGLLPAIIYYLGYTLYFSGIFGGMGGSSRGNNNGLALLIGIALIALSFLFNLFVFHISRLREYYADAHSASVVPDGARKLQRALARIMAVSGRVPKNRSKGSNALKMLMISDPNQGVKWHGDIDELVEAIKQEKPHLWEEIFSTHPHPAKRFMFLDKLASETSS